MAKPSARLTDEYEKLKAEINHHSRLYYVQDQPAISDAEYDKLYDRLLEIEKEYPELITPDSPSQRVGAAPSKRFEPAEHRVPMLSLQKVTTEEEFTEFNRRASEILETTAQIEYVTEPKLDGLAVELVYEKGEFILGSTRGDGSVGETITANLRTIRNIPLKLSPAVAKAYPLLEVRGEVIMRRSAFNKLNEQLASQRPAPDGQSSQRSRRVGAAARPEDHSVTQPHLLRVRYIGNDFPQAYHTEGRNGHAGHRRLHDQRTYASRARHCGSLQRI